MDHPTSSSYFLNLWAIPYFISCGVSLILFTIVLARKRSDRQAQFFILAQFFMALVSLSAALATSSQDPDVWLIWAATNGTMALLASTTLFAFSYVFLIEMVEYKKLFRLYIFPVIVCALIWFNKDFFYPNVIESDQSNLGIFGTEGYIQGVVWDVLYIYFGLMMTGATINYFRAFRQDVDRDVRRRASYFIISSLIFAITITASIFLRLLEQFQLKLEPSIVAISLSGVIIAYGILKDQLFDIDQVVTKGVSYTATTLGVAWVFVLAEESLNHLIEVNFFSGLQLARLVSAIFVVLLFVPLKNVIHNLTDKLFPHAASDHSSAATQYLEIYRKQLEFAWADGVLSEKEKGLLNTLRSSLGISIKEHEQLELEIRINIDKTDLQSH